MKILMLITNRATLRLLDDELHPSGFWAEEFAVPYKRFKQEQYEVDIATIGGIAPTVDKTSIDPGFMRYVRPAGSQDNDSAESAEYIRTIESVPALKAPMNVDTFTKDQVASYDAVYLSGGHGAIGDMAHSEEMAQLFRWVMAMDKPIAAVCHGHCGLLNLRDSESDWPFAGYHMTCFSHSEELVTNMAGRLPFVLEVEVRRLGAIYEKGDVIWGSHVVADRNLVTGQNPHSSAALAETFIKKLNDVKMQSKV
jgi:putative intracellular protease/amidase